MKKPDFIPQDVWDKAIEAANAEQSYIVVAIAAAIMQDRGSRPKDGLDVVVGPAEYDDKGNMKVSYIPSYFPPPYFPPSSPMTNGDGAMEAPIDVPSDIWSAVSAKLWYGMEFRAAVWEACRLVMAERAKHNAPSSEKQTIWPEGIPSDIISTANQCASIWHHEAHHDYQLLAEDFAKALLEERERCALYLEKRAQGLWVDHGDKESSELIEDTAFELRSARHVEVENEA